MKIHVWKFWLYLIIKNAESTQKIDILFLLDEICNGLLDEISKKFLFRIEYYC